MMNSIKCCVMRLTYLDLSFAVPKNGVLAQLILYSIT